MKWNFIQPQRKKEIMVFVGKYMELKIKQNKPGAEREMQNLFSLVCKPLIWGVGVGGHATAHIWRSKDKHKGVIVSA